MTPREFIEHWVSAEWQAEAAAQLDALIASERAAATREALERAHDAILGIQCATHPGKLIRNEAAGRVRYLLPAPSTEPRPLCGSEADDEDHYRRRVEGEPDPDVLAGEFFAGADKRKRKILALKPPGTGRARGGGEESDG